LLISNNPIPIDLYFVKWTNGECLGYLSSGEKEFKEHYTLKEIKKMKGATIYYHAENAYPSLMKDDQ